MKKEKFQKKFSQKKRLQKNFTKNISFREIPVKNYKKSSKKQ